MKSGVPWSVKGVEPDAREAAKAKARRAGLTLGAWLNQVIRESGGVELQEHDIQRWVGDVDDTEPVPFAELGQIASRIETLEQRQIEANREIEQALETLAVRIGRNSTKPAEPDKGLLERLAKLEAEGQKRFERLSREMGMLANRYSDMETRQDLGRQDLEEALDRLTRRAPQIDPAAITKLQSSIGGMESRLDAVARDARSAATTFEHALRAVMERVVTGERRQQEQARNFERALEGLSGQVQAAVEREDSGQTEAIQALEHAVGEITEHFEVIEKRRERASRAVEDAIKNLTERLGESDRRQSEQLHAPLATLDRTVQRMTQRLEEQDNRAQGAISAFDRRIKESDSKIQSALVDLARQFQDSETRAQGTFVSISQRLQETDQKAQDAFAALENKLKDQDEFTRSFAAIDNRLVDIAERIDLNETETKASRLALLRTIDETRRRVSTLEDRPYFVADPPPVQRKADQHEKAEQEPETFASYVRSEEAEPELHPDGVPPARAYTHPEEQEYLAEDEVQTEDRDRGDPSDDSASYKASEPVWALLAAARAAARAQAAEQTNPADEGGASAPDLSPGKFEQNFEDRSGAPATKKVRRKWGRPLVLGAVVLALVGYSVARFANASKTAEDGRPGFAQSLIGSLKETVGGKPHSAVPNPAAIHVAQSAPMPAVSEPKAPENRTSFPAGTPRSASSEPSLIKPAIAADAQLAKPSDSQVVATAIAAIRAAQSAEERESAAADLIKVAESGSAEAQFTLGRVYETGRGVKADLAAARDWYTKAASQGHVAAAFNLGMLEAQSGTREGYNHAVRWFNQAASRGLADAQFNLGMLYAQGLGIGRDPVEAFAWFSAAAAQGDAGAAAERDRIGQALDDQAKSRAEALGRERSAATSRG